MMAKTRGENLVGEVIENFPLLHPSSKSLIFILFMDELIRHI